MRVESHGFTVEVDRIPEPGHFGRHSAEDNAERWRKNFPITRDQVERRGKHEAAATKGREV